MIVAIDSGNSSSKAGVFIDDKLINVSEFNTYDSLINEVRRLHPDQVLICSVNFPYGRFLEDLGSFPVFTLTAHASLPFTVSYKSLQTLGVDRMALAAGARDRFRNKNILIIDAGTCITYDCITARGEYRGGSISPGIDIRFKSLHEFTANLPLVAFRPDPLLIGNSTEHSILSGIIHGTVAEITGMIREYKIKYPDLLVVFSGGNVKFFESKIKDPIFALPNLVLLGLYSIFKYNER